TPELVKNDLDNNLLEKDEFYLIVFDEAHRAVKDYSYTQISKKFYDNKDSKKIPMQLALSASPGSSKEKIQEICSNLYIEQTIIKSEDDKDVLPYVYNIDIEHKRFDIDTKHKEISSIIQSLIDDKIKWLIDNNLIKKKKVENVYRKDLLSLGNYLKTEITQTNNSKNFFLFAALKYQSMSMILLYCRDLIESQGSFSLKKFFDKLKNDKILFSHPKISNLISIVKNFLYISKENVIIESPIPPIYEKDEENKSNLNQKKILIFSQYRDTLEVITNILDEHGIPCRGFYGQSNKKDQKGLGQDKQISILEDFKKGIFPVLVATSVAEEGLDIPNVDLVIFYEPVPSEIRFIQRKGRTGRFSDGKVVVLVANDSIDSKYLEIAQKKILKMKHNLKDINLILHQQNKRSFSIPDTMKATDIDIFNQNNIKSKGNNIDKEIIENFNPIVVSIASNSSKKIKYFVIKLSYKRKDINDQVSFSINDLEHLYDVSLAIDGRKMIGKAQRQIHDLLARAGKEGLEISYLKEIVKFDHVTIEKAIKNLEKIKRIIWINKKTIALIDTIKFIPGRKYSIFIEKILIGKAIVIINEKWYASLDYFDYNGPKSLLKKGNIFNIIGDTYRKNGTLHLIVKKTM